MENTGGGPGLGSVTLCSALNVGYEVYMRHPSSAVKHTHSLEPRGHVRLEIQIKESRANTCEHY